MQTVEGGHTIEVDGAIVLSVLIRVLGMTGTPTVSLGLVGPRHLADNLLGDLGRCSICGSILRAAVRFLIIGHTNLLVVARTHAR